MKTSASQKFFYLFTLGLFIFLFTSCETKITFEKTKTVQEESFSPTEYVTQYYIKFNPRASSSIIITLANGEEYTASDLNPTQASALHAILSEKGIQFDTVDEEFIINRFAYE